MNPFTSSHLRLSCLLILIATPWPGRLPAEEVGDRWGTEEREREYYPIVNIPIPPGTVIEAGAFAVLPDGRMAVGTRHGEIWLIDLGMVQKTRPVLILSVAYKDEERALVSYVARTTSTRGTEYEVPHQNHKLLPGAVEVQSIGTVPYVQLIRRLTVCDTDTLTKVEDALKSWLALR